MAADIIISVANVLYAAALFVRDVLWLRALILLSGVIITSWGAIKAEWVFVAWGGVFFAINGYNIIVLLLERRNVDLAPDLAAIRETVFPELAKREFLNFWNFGAERAAAAGDRICDEGETPEALILIIDGEAAVSLDGRELARLGPRRFVGEISFLTETGATATVEAATGMRMMTWPQAKLRDLGQVNPTLLTKLQQSLGRDLSTKLAGR